ncbi:MAG: DUF359 domain-containing protein [Promethearchaeota archaeon]
MNKILRIPEDRKYEFSQPLGKLISGSREETIPKIKKIINDFIRKNFNIEIYLVGDIVSQDFLKDDFLKRFVHTCVIDEKTQRSKEKSINDEFFDRLMDLENPKGTINPKSFNLFREILNSNKKSLIRVISGEEDLLVLPLILEIPLKENVKQLVFYGQPPITDSKHQIPEGVVMVEVDKKLQKVVKKFIDLMINS